MKPSAAEDTQSEGVRWQLLSPGPGEGGPEDGALTNGVCVLGMHRSGTSLVAGIVRELGVDLGPEEAHLPPDANNQSGYFELADVVAINDEILSHYGGTWDRVPQLPAGWERSEELAEIRDRARRGLSRRFARSRQWGWKDPRTCITLPFWQRLVPGLRYVICLRNPVDIAHSLRAREGEERPLEEHVTDWLRHTASALVYTANRPRLVVQYERFFDDPDQGVEKIASFLGRMGRLQQAETMKRIAQFIDPALMHSRSPSTAVGESPEMPFEAVALYLALELVTPLGSGDQQVDRPEAWATINALARRALPRLPSA